MSTVMLDNPEFVYNKKNGFALKVHSLIVGFTVIYFQLKLPFYNSLIIWGICFFFIYMYLAYKEINISSLLLTPISIFFLWNSINVGLSTAYQGYLLQTGEIIEFSFHHISKSALVESFKIFIIGSYFFHFGLEKLKPINASKIEKSITSKSLKFLFLVSLIFFFFQQELSFVGSLFNPLKFGMVAALSAYALTKIKKLNHSINKKYKLLLIGCILLFTLNIPSMSKEDMMFSFLPILWFSIKNRQVRNNSLLLFLVFIVMYFFIAAPLSSELRYQHWKTQKVQTTEAISNLIKGNTRDIAPSDKSSIESFLSRSSMIVPAAFIVGEVNSFGKMDGETMKYMIFSLIPRLFWPDKPFVSQSAWFTFYLGMANSPEEATSATGMTAVGELYWNFGYIGVIIGMLILGLGFGSLWRLAGNPLNSLISMTLYIIIIFNMREIPEFGSTLVAIIIFFLLFSFLYKVKNIYFNKKVSIKIDNKLLTKNNIRPQ